MSRYERVPKAATIDTVAAELEKLNRHIGTLAQAVDRLTERFSSRYTHPGAERRPYDRRDDITATSSLEALLQVAKTADRHIQLIEQNIASIRAGINGIADDSYLRADLKEFLVPMKKPRG